MALTDPRMSPVLIARELCGRSPSALSACSNSGRSWMWRSFSMSGAPRWVPPLQRALAAGTAQPGWVRTSGGRVPAAPLLPHPGGASRCPAPAVVPVHQALEGEGAIRARRGGSCPCVCGCLCCIFPAFCAPSPDSSPSSWVTPGPPPGPGPHTWSIQRLLSPLPALLIHPSLSLCPRTLSLCLSLSLSFSFSPLLTGFWVCNF